MSLSQDQRAALAALSSGEISDAMENLGLARAVVVSLRACGDERATLFGTAVTVGQIAKHGSDERRDGLVRHGEVARAGSGEGDVIVVDSRGRVDVGSWGEIHTINAARNGVAGVVINGAVRDPAAIRQTGLPVFCKGFSPIKSRWDLATTEVGGAIEIDGVQIRQGDIVFADEAGLLVIPPGQLNAVIAEAQAVQQSDNALKQQYAATA